jgi:hypothetical protein
LKKELQGIDSKIQSIKESINSQLGIFIEEDNESRTMDDGDEINGQYLQKEEQSSDFQKQMLGKGTEGPYYCHPASEDNGDDPYLDDE